MSGGTDEYVMGVYSNTISSSGFSSLPDSKYYNNYTSTNYTGHALTETAGWYSNISVFVNSSYPWFYRGSVYSNSTKAGMFSYDYGRGHSSSVLTSRFVITNE